MKLLNIDISMESPQSLSEMPIRILFNVSYYAYHGFTLYKILMTTKL